MKTLLLTLLLAIGFTTYAQQTDTLQPNGTNGKDAWIWSFTAGENVNFGEVNSQNGGLHNVIRAETWQWQQGQFDTIRGLIYFNTRYINSSAQIISAELDLFFFRNTNFTPQTGENAAFIERIVEPWNETQVTWNNQPATDTAKRKALPKSTSQTQDYLNIDVTELVKEQIKNNGHGWMLKMQTETGFNGITFASSDHTDPTMRPRLRITYTGTNSTRSLANQYRINIYPNPATDNLIVETLETYVFDLELKNSLGQTVLENDLLNLNSTPYVVLPVKHLPEGVYYISINKGEIIKKVVLNR